MVAIFDVGLRIAVLFLTSRVIQGTNYYVEDAWLEEVNGEYWDVDNTNVEVVWTSSTVSGLGVNFTLLKDMTQETTVSPETRYTLQPHSFDQVGTIISSLTQLRGHFNLFRRTNGDYKTHSGISFNLPWCQAIKDRVFMESFIHALNMTECPPTAGTYSVAEWHPSAEKMPAYLPGNQFKIDWVLKDKKTSILHCIILLSLT